mmetsp:Transcript_19772/g.24421  ORF Transcript_19772/g.24421 Transcript_19772/m.24421 type:complete len:84 (+) Transcript_19772:32-283(+)
MVQAGGPMGNSHLINLVKALKREGAIKTARIASVMEMVDRRDFVTRRDSREAYDDNPLSIDHNVTISAPHMHAYCMEWLQHKL